MKKSIYLDYAAATPLDSRVFKVMQPFFSKIYANPSSIHAAGLEAHEAVDKARVAVASLLHAKSEEIIFTSGGTESINLAIKGIAFQKEKGHIIVSQIEHPAVLETCKYLELKGFSVTYLDVDKFGLVSLKKLEKAIRYDTIMISIMYANNEIGTIQPISEIGKLAERHKILFHTDACQAGLLDLNVETLNVDLMTLNGSKIYGPKDAGILYKRSSVSLDPLFHGGHQEFGFRSGTENVAGIVGFAEALRLSCLEKKKESKRVQLLRDYFIAEILRKISGTSLVGHPTRRVPNNISISFEGIEAEILLRHLDSLRIYVATGSACSSQQIEQSHVLKAIGVPQNVGTIRFSLGKETTKAELQNVILMLKKIIASLRLA